MYLEVLEIARYGVPTGIRTPVTAVKGRCPRPLDDRDVLRCCEYYVKIVLLSKKNMNIQHHMLLFSTL